MRILLLLALLLFSPAVQAQVTPSGNFTPGHTVRCANSTCTVVTDAGGSAGSATAGIGSLTELGITNTGTPFCINDAPTSGPYHQLCIGANSLGGGLLSYQSLGGASALPFSFNINGTSLNFPGAGTGNVSGPTTSTIGNVALWNSTTGVLLSNGPSPSLTFGGGTLTLGGTTKSVPNVAPHVATNAALSAAATTDYPNGVWRDSVASEGDAPPLFYYPSGSACSLNTGNGDNGSQVKSSDGKCWLGVFPDAGADVREWGVKFDNSTDNSTALQAAFAWWAQGNILRLPGAD